MAIQKGIIRLSGKLGDLIFYRTKNGYASRNKPTTYTLSEGSKQSGKDFGEASRNANYIRKAFAPLVSEYGDKQIINRLNKKLIEIFKTIPSDNRGKKRLIDGNLSLLKGFEFNNQSPLKDLLWQHPNISIETGSIVNIRLPQGEVDLLFPYHIPDAHEVCLNMMIFCFDLNDGVYEIFKFNELTISLKNPVIGRNKRLHLDLAGHKALIIATGIHFKDEWSKINNSKYYSCQITYAAHLEDGIITNFIEPLKIDLINENNDLDGLDWDIEVLN